MTRMGQLAPRPRAFKTPRRPTRWLTEKLPQPDVLDEKGFAWTARHHLIMRIPATSALIQAAIVCVAVLTATFASVAEGQTNHAARIQRARGPPVASGARGGVVLFRDGNQVIRLAAGYSDL